MAGLSFFLKIKKCQEKKKVDLKSKYLPDTAHGLYLSSIASNELVFPVYALLSLDELIFPLFFLQDVV